MKTIILFALFASACNGNNFLYLNPTNETKEILGNTISDFNQAMGCQAWSFSNDDVKLSDKEAIKRREVKIARSTKSVREYDAKAWGVFDYINNEIFIIEDTENYKLEFFKEGFRFILLHELGHAMGLEHEEDTVMNEKYKFMPYPQALESLISLINEHKKNPCEMIKE